MATEVEIEPGACGFTTRVIARRNGRGRVSLEFDSECPAVCELAEELPDLKMKDVLAPGFGQGQAFEAGSRCLTHAACPVLAGVLKAAEVELELNLPRTAQVRFIDQGED